MSGTGPGAVRRRFSYANVTSTLALFLVIAGGVAVAASVPKNAVKSKSIKDNTVASKDLKDGAAVTGADVVDDSLTGADINESSLAIASGGGEQLADRARRRQPHRHLSEPADRGERGRHL